MKKDINKTECKIQSCKGKYNCLEHCPCDCHSPAEVKEEMCKSLGVTFEPKKEGHSPAEDRKVSKCCGVNGVVSNKQVIGEKIKIDCSKCGKPFEPAELNLASLEEMYVKMKPLVEKMKAKYPKDCNIEGLEPALTNDIAEIVLQAVAEYKAEFVEKIKGAKRNCKLQENGYYSHCGFAGVVVGDYHDCEKEDEIINDIINLISPNKE